MRILLIAIAIVYSTAVFAGDTSHPVGRYAISSNHAPSSHTNLPGCDPNIDYSKGGEQCDKNKSPITSRMVRVYPKPGDKKEEKKSSGFLAVGHACKLAAGANDYTVSGTITNGSRSITCTITYNN